MHEAQEQGVLLELAERCEQAKVADRKLDEDIMFATSFLIVDNPKPYTASLDAAMTLVPEGCRWSLKGEFSGGPDTALEYWSDCSPGYGRQRERGYGKTAALALASAALALAKDKAIGEGES